MSLSQSLGVARRWESASLGDEACRQAGMIGGRRYPILAVTAPKNDPAFSGVGQSPVERLRAENARALGRTQISAL